ERGSGVVRIFFGGPEMDAKPDLVLKGEHYGDGFGKWADGSRDVDGDGIADLLVSAPWADVPAGPGGGRVYLYLGGRKIDAVPDAVLDGPAAGAVFGWGACLVPDRGHGSLLVGVKDWSRALTQSGGVQGFGVARAGSSATRARVTAGRREATRRCTGRVPPAWTCHFPRTHTAVGASCVEVQAESDSIRVRSLSPQIHAGRCGYG